MLTRWGKIASGILLGGGTSAHIPIFPFVESPYKATGLAKDVNGTEYYFAPYPATTPSFTTLATSLSATGIIIGTGSTPATVDDYSLESMITSGVTGNIPSTSTVTFDGENNQYVLSRDVTIANNGAQSITISEIGIISTVFAASSKGGNVNQSTYRYVLVDRTVLDEPVTIPTGESGVVRYKFCYDCDFTKPET